MDCLFLLWFVILYRVYGLSDQWNKGFGFLPIHLFGRFKITALSCCPDGCWVARHASVSMRISPLRLHTSCHVISTNTQRGWTKLRFSIKAKVLPIYTWASIFHQKNQLAAILILIFLLKCPLLKIPAFLLWGLVLFPFHYFNSFRCLNKKGHCSLWTVGNCEKIFTPLSENLRLKWEANEHQHPLWKTWLVTVKNTDQNSKMPFKWTHQQKRLQNKLTWC